VQVYEPNLKDFSDLDEEDVQEEELNIINPNEYEDEVNKEYSNSILVVES
jgi:hypothetical protein